MLLITSVLAAEEDVVREDTFPTFRIMVEPTREERVIELPVKVDPVTDDIVSWDVCIEDAITDDATIVDSVRVLALKEDIPNP